MNKIKKIELLDRQSYDVPKLLTKMNDDSFYYGELNKLALSSSSLKLLLDSPKTYKYVSQYSQPESQPLRDGWLFHTAILEPDVFESQIFVDVQSKNTKKFRDAKLEHGSNRIFTIKERKQAERLMDAFYRNERALQLIGDAQFEVPAIGEVMGFPFRGKADVLGNDGRIVDLKTTSDIKAFPYSAKKYSYDLQCFLYCHLFNVDYRDFKFLVMDKSSLDLGVWDCSEQFYHSGEQKCERALDVYEKFFIDGVDIDSYFLEGTL